MKKKRDQPLLYYYKPKTIKDMITQEQIISILEKKGICNSTLFRVAEARIKNQYDQAKEFNADGGLRMSNCIGDVSEDGLITIKTPFLNLFTVCFGDVKAVKVEDFISFVGRLTAIEIGNIKADYYSMPVELVGVLPLGYFSYIEDENKRNFTYDILIKWGQKGLDNKQLVTLMKAYLRARVNWKWENIDIIPDYWRASEYITVDVWKEMSECHSNAKFDRIATQWGMTDLPATHPRKIEFARLMVELLKTT